MRYTDLEHTSFRFGSNLTPPADLVGGCVLGSLSAPRTAVQDEALYRAAHELELPEGFSLDQEAYATVFQYPRDGYIEHLRKFRSPKGYSGPAACCRLVWDIDRSNLDAALGDARKLAKFLLTRYGDFAEAALSIWFSGAKGFHITLLNPPGFVPLVHCPAVAKSLCLALAKGARIVVDPAIYDRQRLFRLPNSRHQKTGLYKRFILLDDLERMTVPTVLESARHPAGYPLPTITEDCEQLARDWLEAERNVLARSTATPNATWRIAPSSAPTVPKFIRDFIGFGDVQDPGRAITLFRCAAALAEAGTPPAVVYGLLEEPALKTGLDSEEVAKQIGAGIEHGKRSHGRGIA
jgi:hypothetical protein